MPLFKVTGHINSCSGAIWGHMGFIMSKARYPIPKAPKYHTDLAGLGGWVPPALLPYAQILRLDRPAGYWLLLLPAWYALFIASPEFGWQTVWLLLLFFIGAVALRGAGCVINDLWDRDLDRRVTRTADRPLASGALSGRRALALIFGLILVGVLVLLFLPWRVWGWAVLSLPLIALYPLAKRYIPTPQAALALTFSWGAILGWLAVQPHFTMATLWLYLGTFAWILYYDTIYACQDRVDDARLGLNSMPLFLGEALKPGLIAFAGLTLICWALALAYGQVGGFAWVGLLVFAGLIARQLHGFDPDRPAQCLDQFKANVAFGQVWCLFLGLDFLF